MLDLRQKILARINDRAEEDRFPPTPQRIVHDVRKVMPEDGIVCLDNGMYKIWFARNYRTHVANTLLLDNALATMGAGLPSAMMAAMLHPDRRVMAVCGDGGFMMNSQEMETAVRLGLNLVVVILNDSAYGMIRWKQAGGRFSGFRHEFRQSRFRALRRSLWRQGFPCGCGRGSGADAGGRLYRRRRPSGRRADRLCREHPRAGRRVAQPDTRRGLHVRAQESGTVYVLNVAIAGFGGVGRAVAHLLLSRRERYLRLYGTEIRLVAVCGSSSGLADAQGLEPERLDELEPGLSGPDFVIGSGATVLIEAGPSDYRTGGPGLAYLRRTLAEGIDAIVISKGALVHSGPELRALAEGSGAMLRMSGAAAAALPTIDLVEHSLLGCTVLQVEGILNATTNYLLDAMTGRGIDFEEALREAPGGRVRGSGSAQ